MVKTREDFKLIRIDCLFWFVLFVILNLWMINQWDQSARPQSARSTKPKPRGNSCFCCCLKNTESQSDKRQSESVILWKIEKRNSFDKAKVKAKKNYWTLKMDEVWSSKGQRPWFWPLCLIMKFSWRCWWKKLMIQRQNPRLFSWSGLKYYSVM